MNEAVSDGYFRQACRIRGDGEGNTVSKQQQVLSWSEAGIQAEHGLKVA